MKTPPPWTIYDDADPLKIGIKGFTRQLGSVHVATVIMPENAALIIEAVNNHDALMETLEKIEYASRKDSLTEHERLQSVRTVVCAALSRLNRAVGTSGDRS